MHTYAVKFVSFQYTDAIIKIISQINASYDIYNF